MTLAEIIMTFMTKMSVISKAEYYLWQIR